MPTGTSPAHQPVLTILQALLDGNPSLDIESSIALLPSTANAHSREEALISILNSHPWSPKDSTTFNLANEYGQNLAHLCAQLGYHRLLTFVIERGVDINVKDADGWMALDFARFYGDLNAVDILEGDWECDVEVPVQAPSMSTDVSTPSTSAYEAPACAQLKLVELMPHWGPRLGGQKILIVGSGFEAEQRLTIHFGPNPPVKTEFITPNVLSCILPPSPTVGTTSVTLHWLEGTKARASADHCEFTYTNEREQLYVNLSQSDIQLIVF